VEYIVYVFSLVFDVVLEKFLTFSVFKATFELTFVERVFQAKFSIAFF
jgi:hypothetical protein